MYQSEMIGGMRVVISDAFTEYDLAERCWWERLFTRPWRPWQSHKCVYKDVPPKFRVDQAKGIIYTTERGYLALRQETQRAH